MLRPGDLLASSHGEIIRTVHSSRTGGQCSIGCVCIVTYAGQVVMTTDPALLPWRDGALWTHAGGQNEA